MTPTRVKEHHCQPRWQVSRLSPEKAAQRAARGEAAPACVMGEEDVRALWDELDRAPQPTPFCSN